MLLFVGQFQHSLDDKGRLILPAKFRREFEGGGHLSPNMDGCVALWTPGEFARRSAEYLNAGRNGSPDERRQSRFWATNSSEVEIDRQGRFALPPVIRDFGQLEGDVIVAGNLDHVELWNPQRYAAQVSDAEATFIRGSDE
jgi:MraZ protein